MLYFHKFVKFSKAAFTTYIAKTYFPLLQQIADSLKKIGLEGTLPQDTLNVSKVALNHVGVHVTANKIRFISAKNVIFSLLCIAVDRPMGGGGVEPPTPSCVHPWIPILVCCTSRSVGYSVGARSALLTVPTTLPG